jgi:2-dehydropantoate 2-reductase
VTTVTVVGAGGVGTVLAAGLAEAGHTVVVCARSANRLVLERDGVAREVSVPVVTDPAAVSGSQWVLLCTKAQDTTAAAPWLARACRAGTAVLVCQNGIDHVERVAGLIGPATAIPALVYIAAERISAGRVRHRNGEHIIVPAGPDGERVAGLAPTGIEVRVDGDFRTAAWRKLLTNVAANPITALTHRRMEVFDDPGIRDLAVALLNEAIEVGRAVGARLGPGDLGTTLALYDGFAPQDGTSMLYDRLAGRATEHELFNGTVAALGRRHDVPTPVNSAVHTLLRATEPGPATPRRTPP